MWDCVISGGVIACQSARNCFKYYNLWYAVRFAWCHWGKISKFNIFHFLPASAVSVSDNFSSPHGDSRWGRGKWLEVTVVSSDGSVPLTFAEDANYTNTWVQMYELWKTSAHSKCHGVYVIWRYNPGPLRCAGYFRVETSMVGCHVTNRQAVMSGHRRSAVWLIEAIMHMYSCINATKHLKMQK